MTSQRLGTSTSSQSPNDEANKFLFIGPFGKKRLMSRRYRDEVHVKHEWDDKVSSQVQDPKLKSVSETNAVVANVCGTKNSMDENDLPKLSILEKADKSSTLVLPDHKSKCNSAFVPFWATTAQVSDYTGGTSVLDFQTMPENLSIRNKNFNSDYHFFETSVQNADRFNNNPTTSTQPETLNQFASTLEYPQEQSILEFSSRCRTENKKYQCSDCGKEFSQLRNFKYHKSRHEGTSVFACTCPLCGKYFNDRGYLSSHLKIHKNAKEYQCHWCWKSFNQKVAYNMHIKIHTGHKPHVCPTCPKAFSRKMLLRQHLRTHTGERPFSCAVCGKSFSDRSNMLLHQKLHTGHRPYKCPFCDKTFSKNHHLKTHINHHSGIKPYKCDVCDARFSQSSNMRTHRKKCEENMLQQKYNCIGSTYSSEIKGAGKRFRSENGSRKVVTETKCSNTSSDSKVMVKPVTRVRSQGTNHSTKVPSEHVFLKEHEVAPMELKFQNSTANTPQALADLQAFNFNLMTEWQKYKNRAEEHVHLYQGNLMNGRIHGLYSSTDTSLAHVQPERDLSQQKKNAEWKKCLEGPDGDFTDSEE